jgi:hypothetical protein
MRQFKTTLGLTNEGGGYAFPLSFSIEPIRRAVKPAKNVKLYAVNVYSLRHAKNSLERFRTAYQASQFIERINKEGIFIANIIK